MDKAELRSGRILWADLCREGEYLGQWVALESVRYDSGVPVEGAVVDWDENLATLCARIQSADHVACAILFCDDKASGIRRGSA